MKGSVDIEKLRPFGLAFYAGLRLDAGPGPRPVRTRSAIAEYLGDTDAFDQSITDFSERYADQNERDYPSSSSAIRSGRLEAVEGV